MYLCLVCHENLSTFPIIIYSITAHILNPRLLVHTWLSQLPVRAILFPKSFILALENLLPILIFSAIAHLSTLTDFP